MMMNDPSVQTLINAQTGKLAFKWFSFTDNSPFDQVQRNSYYTLVWVKQGSGIARVDFSEYGFARDTLFAFAPYQPFMFLPDAAMEGVAINFHPDFFCIHKHQNEVACNGVLFNNIYQPPFLAVDAVSAAIFDNILNQINTEMQTPALAQYELLISYLKIILITASRLKVQQQPAAQAATAGTEEPFILQKLKNYIELNFKNKHSPGNYADMLNITPKALAKIAKTHFNKTLTDLIAERIIIEAKRELYLSDKPIKSIAHELGYMDESYFSRFFKNNTLVSPQTYRDTVGFNRADA